MTREEVIASLQLNEVPESLATSLRAEGRDEVAGEVALAGEMRVIFELDAEADSSAVIEAVRGLVGRESAATLSVSVDEALSEAEIKAEMAKEAVRARVLGIVSVKATKEEIVGEIATSLEVPYIKALVGEVKETAPVVNGGSGKADDSRVATVWA